MRGRSGLVVMLAAALLIAGGCTRMTPEQKRQKQLDKQATAAAKAEQKRAAADAKAQAAAQKKQMEMERKQADAQAKALKQQQADEQKRQDALAKQQAKQADAQAKADKKAADVKLAEDKRQAALSAKEQKKQADMMAKADKQKARDEKPAAAMAMADNKRKASSDYYPDDQLKVIGYPLIKPENRQRLLDRHVEAMESAGQYQDATLSEADFDGAELNATGRANLALALNYPKADNKVTLYINTAGGEDVTAARAASVERYWKASQWSGVQLATKAGPNPNATAPAGPGIAALKRMEKQQAGTSATASGSDTTSGRSRMGGEARQGE